MTVRQTKIAIRAATVATVFVTLTAAVAGEAQLSYLVSALAVAGSALGLVAAWFLIGVLLLLWAFSDDERPLW